MTGKTAERGGGVMGGGFKTARHRRLLKMWMPDGRPIRVSVEESDLQRLVKIFDRWYNSLFDRIFATQTGVHFAGKCSMQAA
jgi:hypothetical protein